MTDRLADLRQRAERLRGQREALTAEYARAAAEADVLVDREDLLVKVVAVLHSLLDQLLKSKAEDMARLLTEGCRAIFYDQKLSVEADVAVRRNRVNIDLTTVHEHASGQAVRGDVLETFGGGIAAVQGIILRLYSVLRLGLRPLVAADEPLAAVSAQYVPKVGAFLRQFCEATGLDLLLVTHEPSFMEHAHTAYEAKAMDDATTAIRQLHRETSG